MTISRRIFGKVAAVLPLAQKANNDIVKSSASQIGTFVGADINPNSANAFSVNWKLKTIEDYFIDNPLAYEAYKATGVLDQEWMQDSIDTAFNEARFASVPWEAGCLQSVSVSYKLVMARRIYKDRSMKSFHRSIRGKIAKKLAFGGK